MLPDVANLVGKRLGIKPEPHRSRTCNLLIKSKKHDMPPSPS